MLCYCLDGEAIMSIILCSIFCYRDALKPNNECRARVRREKKSSPLFYIWSSAKWGELHLVCSSNRFNSFTECALSIAFCGVCESECFVTDSTYTDTEHCEPPTCFSTHCRPWFPIFLYGCKCMSTGEKRIFCTEMCTSSQLQKLH